METIFKTYILLLLAFSALAFSQVKISGKVLYHKKPVNGADVTLKDTYDGATTDANGNFSFETNVKGTKILVFTAQGYNATEQNISIDAQPITINADLQEKVSEINAVVINVGSLESGDKKRSSAALTPMDIYQTAGANGSTSEGYKFLPGVQRNGDSEGLFVRGGTGAETKFFMDGNLVNNFFSTSYTGIPGHDRFNTNIFKGSNFSTGGYSALYGQALSAVLILESIDLPEKSSAGFFIMPFSLSGNVQKLNKQQNASFGVEAKYFNFGLMTKLLKSNNDFIKAPENIDLNVNFRFKTKSGGFLKYYGSIDTNSLAFSQPSLELNYGEQQPEVKGKNTFHSLSFKQKFGKYLLNSGASFSDNEANVAIEILNAGAKIGDVQIDTKGLYLNHKTVLERNIGGASNVKVGYELQFSNDTFENQQFASALSSERFKNLISAVFAEANVAVSTKFSMSGGLRGEYSSYLSKWNLAPRIAAAYKLSDSWVTSFAYGKFFQMPEARFLTKNLGQTSQQADHYIFQLERRENNRTLRGEIFYKNYRNLEKNVVQNFITTPENAVGKGFAKGAEIFWNDKKTIKGLSYWIAYSYLDTKRDYLNYPQELFPSFASRHNISIKTSKFISKWKSGFGISYVYASPRPSYGIAYQNGKNVLVQEKASKNYNSLNVNGFYVPNLGKKDEKSFSILVAGINNVLNFKNNFGYRYSQDALRSTAVLPSTNMMFYIGANFTFGIDRTQETIDNL